MRVAVSQINPTLGDFKFNETLIINQIQQLTAKKAELIVFPEACLFGYHPFDLLERKKLVQQQNSSLKKILKEIPKNVFVLIGGFELNKGKGRPYFNTAFLCTKNKVVRTFHKELLPTGDVFDEARFVEKGKLKENYFEISGYKFFLTICEDIWAWDNPDYQVNPIDHVKKKKTDLVINMSASPFHVGKLKLREHVTRKTAQAFKAPILYANLVGAQDEVIYDGASFVMNPNGKKLFQLLSFDEDSNVFDLESKNSWSPRIQIESEMESLRKSLVLGIRDFVKKTGFERVHLGLSGGIDSAVVTALAVDALGPRNVKVFALPTQFNLAESFTAANQLAKNLNLELSTQSIQKLFELFKNEIDLQFGITDFSLVHENLQSRIRGVFLMAYSNFANSILLSTGNKSEIATGYATLYGDMCGGLAPIGDLTKKQVYGLAKLYNKETEIIPNFIVDRPPSAELRPNQKDQDSLPPYDQLDKAVVKIVEQHREANSKTEKWLLERIAKSEFKRWQSAPILKVSSHSFGRGRRYPIAHKAKG